MRGSISLRDSSDVTSAITHLILHLPLPSIQFLNCCSNDLLDCDGELAKKKKSNISPE